MKSLKDISLSITEEEYRADGAMHYSTLAKFNREGFKGLSTLFDRVESPSLLFGSCVDAIITGDQEEFDNRFMVADFPSIGDKELRIVKAMYQAYHNETKSFLDFSSSYIKVFADQFEFQKNWKDETRVKVLKERCEQYYKLLFLAEDKTIVDCKTYADVCKCVDALRTSKATGHLFAQDNPFEPHIERLYQLKFHIKRNGIWYSCMMDEVYVDHNKKIIIPIDLKTSSHNEYEFFKSFIEWSYHIQARQYFLCLEEAVKNDDYFKDFNILNYHFVVVNRNSLVPLVWEFKDTKKRGTLYYGKNNQIEFRDPLDLGEELQYYLTNNSVVPKEVFVDKPNDIISFLNKM